MTREDAKPRGRLLVVDQPCGVRLRPPQVPGWWFARLAAAVSLALSLASCASTQKTIGGWFGAATPTPAPTPQAKAAATAPRVFFAGTEGMKLYKEPSASSKVIAELSLHERVTRLKLERGFAYVESAGRGLKGWVNNSQLIWRLPGGATTTAEPEPEAPAAGEAQPPQAPEATAPAVEPPATPTQIPAAAAPSPKATPGGVAPSIFNPY